MVPPTRKSSCTILIGVCRPSPREHICSQGHQAGELEGRIDIAHAHRSRDLGTRRIELPEPIEGGQFPGHQDPRRFQVPDLFGAEGALRLAGLAGVVRAKENLILVGRRAPGKSHLLVGLGHAAVRAGLRVRYFAASDLVETSGAKPSSSSRTKSAPHDLADRVVGEAAVKRPHRHPAPLPLHRRRLRATRTWHRQPLAFRPMGMLAA